MHLKRLFAAALAFALTACPGPTPPPEKDPYAITSTTELALEIGPEGGELVAPADHPLAGVRLKVPAGALTTKVRLTLDGSMESTGLSGAAEQVGPQFVIGPADVTYVTPLELTVPIEEEALAAHAQGSEECKVWHFTGSKWTRLERKSGDATSVTVDLPAPGAAAAGVISRVGTVNCLTDPVACRTVTKTLVVGNSCSDPSGYCLVALPRPSAAPIDLNPGFAVVNRKLYYAHAPAAGRITVARYDLATGETVVFTSHPVPGLSGVANVPVAVEADGSAWLGLQQFGNVRFRESQTPFAHDVGTGQLGKGAVVVGGKVVRILTKSGIVHLTDGATTHSLAPRTALVAARARPTESTRFVALSSGVFLDIDFDANNIVEPFNLGSVDFTAVSFVNDGFGAARNTSGVDVTLWKTVNNGSQVLQSGNHMVTFDAEDTFYGMAGVPELRLFEAAGGFARVPLTDEPSTSSAYGRLAPRALLGVAGRKELVFISRGDFETSTAPRVRDYYLLQKGD